MKTLAPREQAAAENIWHDLAIRLQLNFAVIRAVAEVESAGSGFVSLDDPRPKVLFEGHYFHRLTTGKFDASHPKLSYPKWSKEKYAKTAAGEWQRLEAAMGLDREAALQAASWGTFQIMGANYGACGFNDINAFVQAQSDMEGQLDTFAKFVSRPPFIALLKEQNWEGFAEAYNGPAYASNRYAEKLAAAYAKYSASSAKRKVARKATISKGSTNLPPGRAEAPRMVAARRSMTRRNVKPDAPDLRDWAYRPQISVRPENFKLPTNPRVVKNQDQTNACTGFGLATTIEYLLAAADRPVEEISGFMLYSMARRYDEWAEGEEKDSGSSLRGALKGWSKHGASRHDLWKTLKMPKAIVDPPEKDWWPDAMKRPMGAYYRLDLDLICDMHSAICEAHVVYASVRTHAGWDKLNDRPDNRPPTDIKEIPLIDHLQGDPEQGHAFAIVGYTADGFIVHNSWGPTWGHGGFAVLLYSDWLENAMDCWVVQLGVVTTDHLQVADQPSLPYDSQTGRVRLSASPTVAAHALAPFIVDLENEGGLSERGSFRTNEDDLRALLGMHLTQFRMQHGMTETEEIDVALYAHGGLVGEDSAETTARTWIPLLYENRIFPIFVMWETGAFKTIGNIVEDLVKGEDSRAGGWANLKEKMSEWKNRRIEALVRQPGQRLWGQMKQNANAVSSAKHSGLIMLLNQFKAQFTAAEVGRFKLHLVGHSAGTILHTHLLPRADSVGLRVNSLSFLAPAVTMDLFAREAGPLIEKKKIRTLVAYLTDQAERADRCAKVYGNSLLYLVSRACEAKHDVPLLGMEKFLIPAIVGNAWGEHVTRLDSNRFGGSNDPGESNTRTHGGVDNDCEVQKAVIANIKSAS